MTEHTPGPWEHSPFGFISTNAISKSGEEYTLVIASIDPDVQLLYKRLEMHANINLMLVAPDLLEACEEMLNWLSINGVKNDMTKNAEMVISKTEVQL